MRALEIATSPNGGHNNQSCNIPFPLLEGWVVIPDDMETPNFPYGEVEVEEIDGVMTVTKWVAGVIPEVEEVEKPITETEQLRADIDYIAVMTGVEL